MSIYYHNIGPNTNDFDKIVADIERQNVDLIILIELFKPYGTTLDDAKANFARLLKYKLHLYEHNVAIFTKADTDDFDIIHHTEFAVTFRYHGLVFTAAYIGVTEEGKKTSKRNEKFQLFVDHLKKVIGKDKQQLILGDFNLHFNYSSDGTITDIPSNALTNCASWTRRSHTQFSTIMANGGFKQKNFHPNSSGNYLDVFFSNIPEITVTVEKIENANEEILSIKRERHHDRLKATIVGNTN